MKTIFSIGLNVGTQEPARQLSNTLNMLVCSGRVESIALGRGEWQGVPERFIQARIEVKFADVVASVLARELSQDCVAFRADGDYISRWQLAYADGTVVEGCTLADNPIILSDVGYEKPARQPVTHGADTLAHSSIQPWSAGEFFPAIIAQIESYPHGRSAADSEPSISHELTIGGFREAYASYADARMVAMWACADGKIIPERYAQLTRGAGRSMAAFRSAT